jgi:hypothetical protein
MVIIDKGSNLENLHLGGVNFNGKIYRTGLSTLP